MKNFNVGDSLALEFTNHYKIYKVQKATLHAVTLESGLIVGQDLKLHANVPVGLVRVLPVTQEIKDAIKRQRQLKHIMRYIRSEHRSLVEKASKKQLDRICNVIRRMINNG
jgi:hypothetical protein